MRARTGVWIHTAVFVAAVGLAVYMESRPEELPGTGRAVAEELWGGSRDKLESVHFESEELKVDIVPRRDKTGAYYLVTTEKPAQVLADADAGTSQPEGPQVKRFVSVDQAEVLTSALMPFVASRKLGRIEEKRLGDFGLDKPSGHLKVTVAGKVHEVTVGSLTPGSDDYYVRQPSTGQVYTFSSEQLNRLKFADNRLLERDLHGFRVDEVKGVRITVDANMRALVALEGKTDAWADPATPTTVDETAGNFLSKLARLRPMGYVEQLDGLGPAIFSVDYLDRAGAALGRTDLFRHGEGGEAKYFARTERSRWFAEVQKSTAEQLTLDSRSVSSPPR